MEAKDSTSQAKKIQQYLMSGVSYMIPVVVTGGVLYAIAAMLSMNTIATESAVKASNIVVDVLSQIGGVGLGLMVPVLLHLSHLQSLIDLVLLLALSVVS